MATFDKRQKAFEAEFAHDQETKFKIEVRRDRLVGQWAASKLGKSGEEADEYARSVVRADMKEPGDNDVFEKLRADLPKGSVSDEDIRQAMSEALEKAMSEKKKS